MNWDAYFFINSILLGVGLAMDSFSVSIANAMSEPEMKLGKRLAIAGTFGGFQALMPLIGWVCVRFVVELFAAFEPFIPWIALLLLLYIGGKMLWEGIRGRGEDEIPEGVGFWGLMLQGVATAIDALSVGFTIEEYDLPMALVSVLIIGVVTFAISLAGCLIGRKAGKALSSRAPILGGVILIFIGLEIFIRGVFFK